MLAIPRFVLLQRPEVSFSNSSKAKTPDLLDSVLTGRQGERTDLFDNIKEVSIDPPTGTSRAHALRKLRKDAPELHSRVINLCSRDTVILTKVKRWLTDKPGRRWPHKQDVITDNVSNNVSPKKKRTQTHGTSRAYTLERLKREAPALYARVL